ncbi:MAG TPA: hypothetical protein DHW82_07390 [Spirochaetia bacterium]|nr:MAG: hypothetical protein A2Y41_12205 [Spirochaetes bacterium GWB1_36_13]HCL56816.1 hypothetical protein [Spirochaetia bacterium]
MNQFGLPILLAAVTAFITLLGGLFGRVDFLTVVKRIFMFSLLMGGLGFGLTVLLSKWGIDLASDSNQSEDSQTSLDSESVQNTDFSSHEDVPINMSESLKEENSGNKDDEGMFDYTVKDDDDEEIVFKPLDESLLSKKLGKHQINLNGEKMDIEPQKAAMAIRQLLSEDKENGE